MEGQSSKGTPQHQYPSQSEQWSRLVRRNTLATSTSPFPPSALLHSPQVSTTIEAFPELFPQQTTAYQVQLAQYNKLIASGRAPRVPASPLPPLLSTQHIQAVPRSGTSGYEGKQRRITSPRIGHGNKKSHNTGTGDRSLIAAAQSNANANTANMAAKKSDAPKQPARSQQQHSAHAQQSSSVPSTPNQRARKFSNTSRDPSPVLATNHSPRSAYSESNTTVPTYRPLASRLGQCPYETGMAHFKRRMPYKLGCERLEPAKLGSVKTKLSPEEDQKLSKDVEKLYEQLVPTPESEARRKKFLRKLENLLNTEWSGHDIRVHVFGSSGNMLCTDDSDVDICITTEWKELERVCMLADLLAKHGMTHINCVSAAKVPIVKVWDPELGLACDMNVNNALALENTRMIKTYVEIDWRVRPLAMIVKHWTKRRIVNDAAYGGTLSSYTWICMIINFLQLRKPPILPSLHQWQEKKPDGERGDCDFADNLDELRHFGQSNKQSLGDLLFQFFRFYAHEFDYDNDVVSVRQGKLIDKKAKGWHITNNNGLCVEEPFNIGRNLGNTADDFSVRGLHIELRRAFDLVAEARLDECCEQYAFPKEEERIWEKPVPQQPRPLVISRSASQSRGSRGGHGGSNGNRGGRNNNHRNGASSRRASSATTYEGAAASNNNNTHSQNSYTAQPTLSAPPLPSMPQQNDPWMSNQQAQNQLHELYMNLEAQKDNLLRLQLYSQEQGFQQSQARLEHFAQAHRQHAKGSITAQHATDRHRGLSFDNPAPSTAPMYYFYPVPPFQQPQMYSQQSSITYPSSPSMPAAQPELRRSLHRSNVATASGTPQQNTMANSAMRSHSQPAARTGFAPYPFQYAMHGAPQMQQHMNGVTSHSQMINEPGENSWSEGHRNPFESTSMASVEKDYKGYSVNGAITYQNPMDSVAQPSVSASVAAPSRRRLSTEQFPQAVLERIRRTSRSPSPIGRGPAYSAGSRSVPTISEMPQSLSYGNVEAPLDQTPMVVNGSTPIDISSHESRGPSSISGSSGDEFHDALAESFDSFTLSSSETMQMGHAETMVLRASGPYVNGMEQYTNGMNGNADVFAQKAVLPKLTTIPSLEHKRTSPKSTSPVNSGHKASPDTRSRHSKHVTGNISSLDIGQRIEQARESQPHLSPVYEARAPTFSSSSKAEGKANGTHGNSLNEGNRGSRRNQDNGGQKSQPPSPAKGHTRNSRSEGSGHASHGNNWSQIPNKSKKKGLGVDKNKVNLAHVPSAEELPKRDSDRKGG